MGSDIMARGKNINAHVKTHGGRNNNAILTVQGRVRVPDAVSKKIGVLGLKKQEAIQLSKKLQYLNAEQISVIEKSPNVHKAVVKGNKIYSLRTSNRLRVMFGIDEKNDRVLVYDIVDVNEHRREHQS